MKFSQMVYERPDIEQVKGKLTELTARFAAAESYEEAKKVFLEEDKLERNMETVMSLAHIRHTIDTRDEFYDGEMKFIDESQPLLTEYVQKWTETLLKSPFRAEFEEEFGKLTFINAEIEQKTFAPEIIPMLQEENELATKYEKLLASAQIP